MKIIAILILALPTFAYAKFGEFTSGLKGSLYFDKDIRTSDLNSKIRLTKFSKIAQILNPDAIATYNDKTNTISLNEDLLLKTNFKTSIKNAGTIFKRDMTGLGQVATVFHELGHAELDIFIENEITLIDLEINQFYKRYLKDIYKNNFKIFNAKHLFHEHFAYYRTEMIERMSFKIMDTYLENGWNAQGQTCFLTHNLRNQLENNISLDDFKKFKSQTDTDFSVIQVRYIYFKGKEFDLNHIPQQDIHIIKTFHKLMWDYHQEFYGVPKTLFEIIDEMNRDKKYERFRECREEMWKKYFNL